MSKSAITFQPDRWPGCEVDYTIGFLDHADTAVDLHLLAHNRLLTQIAEREIGKRVTIVRDYVPFSEKVRLIVLGDILTESDELMTQKLADQIALDSLPAGSGELTSTTVTMEPGIGSRIRSKREGEGVSREKVIAVAARLKITDMSLDDLWEIEEGVREPTVEEAISCCHAIDERIGSLLWLGVPSGRIQGMLGGLLRTMIERLDELAGQPDTEERSEAIAAITSAISAIEKKRK